MHAHLCSKILFKEIFNRNADLNSCCSSYRKPLILIIRPELQNSHKADLQQQAPARRHTFLMYKVYMLSLTFINVKATALGRVR